LAALPAHGQPRSREGERAKARARWSLRRASEGQP
jgi:hypothetical protein